MSKKFFAYNPDIEDDVDAREIKACDHEDAAEQYAELYDRRSGEGYEKQRFVLVCEYGQTEWVKFRVRAEPDVNYYAYKE